MDSLGLDLDLVVRPAEVARGSVQGDAVAEALGEP